VNEIAAPFGLREGPSSLGFRPVLRVLRRKPAPTVNTDLRNPLALYSLQAPSPSFSQVSGCSRQFAAPNGVPSIRGARRTESTCRTSSIENTTVYSILTPSLRIPVRSPGSSKAALTGSSTAPGLGRAPGRLFLRSLSRVSAQVPQKVRYEAVNDSGAGWPYSATSACSS
jgi:hypothetical protein